MIEKSRNSKLRARAYVARVLSESACAWFGESNPMVLEFDHGDHSSKSHNVSRMVSMGYAVAAVAEEVAKCVVLCANCHRVKTHKERGTQAWHRYGDKYKHGPDAACSTRDHPPKTVRVRRVLR